MLKSNFGRVVLLLGVCVIAYAMHDASQKQAVINDKAVSAGFSDAAEMESATAKGFKDPAEWRKNKAEQEARETEMKRDPATKMTLAAMTWNVGGFGTIGIINVTVDNANDFGVKDIAVRCIFSGKSGTELSSTRHTIFDTIAAKSKKVFREVNVGFINSQSARARCEVETARRA